MKHPIAFVQTVRESPRIVGAAGPYERTMPVHATGVERTLVACAVVHHEYAVPFHQVVHPLAFVLVAIAPEVSTVAVHCALPEIAAVDVARVEGKDTTPFRQTTSAAEVKLELLVRMHHHRAARAAPPIAPHRAILVFSAHIALGAHSTMAAVE